VSERELREATARVLDTTERGSGPFLAPTPVVAQGEKRDAKPVHYKVICISMYTRDLARMDALVEALKARGVTKANRSALIRAALEQVDLDKIPRGM
jgi:hypothetical protein